MDLKLSAGQSLRQTMNLKLSVGQSRGKAINLKLMLDKTVKQYGEKTAVAMGERRVTYAELDEASNKVANALLALRVKKGDRVAMLLSNRPEFVSVYFGIVKSGGIPVPMDTRYKVEEATNVLVSCRPRVLVVESLLLEPLVPALPRFDFVERVITVGPTVHSQFLSYEHIIASGPAQKPQVPLTPDDIATISYSGGGTNHPAGAMLSHHSLVTEAVVAGDGFKQTAQDVVMLFALPMYHMFGLGGVLLTAINKGSTLVMVPGTGVSIGSLMEAIEQEKGTILFGVPYIYALAVKLAKREGINHDLSSLRLCVSGGAPLSVNTIQQFKQYYGFTITDIYGLTEAICHVTCPPIDGTGKIGSVGRALPGFEIKIVDDNGAEVPANHVGEVAVKGHIMKGYYNNPQATARAIKNGWLHTGDLGRLDKDGYLFITGLKKRMINLKGQNIYPDDIEEVLATHSKIAETKVMGVSDRLRGEVVRAYIRLKPGEVLPEPELRQFCQIRMADYKVPRQIIFTDVLPEAAAARSGKKHIKEYLPKLPSLPYPPAKQKRDLGAKL